MDALLVVHARDQLNPGETCLAGGESLPVSLQFIQRMRRRHGSVGHLSATYQGRLLINPVLHPLGGEPVFKHTELDLLEAWIEQHARLSGSVLNVLGSMETSLYRDLLELSLRCAVRLHFAPGLMRLVA